MSDELKDTIKKTHERFKDFSNFIELEDLRAFLLFTVNSQAPSNILAQMGLGGSKDVINLPYNPLFKIHYQKINLITAGSLIIYVKGDPLSEEFVMEKDDPVFNNYLNTNELDLAFRGKEKFLIPRISDCSSIELDGDSKKISVEVDDLFYSLESFMAITEPNIVFVLDGKSNEPDILFAFNMMPELKIADKKVLKIDGYLDAEHKTKGMTFIKREEDYSLEFLKDIKAISNADLYKSAFSLIVRIKSLNKPF